MPASKSGNGLAAGRGRIAVVGAGIGGLATVAFLRRAGLPATVYEQARVLREVGAALVVAPNAARLLRRLPATLLAGGSENLPDVLLRYERLRLPRASRVQEASRGRIAHHHLPDGPEQRSRDAAFAAEDPLSHNDWIYAYDAEDEAATAAVTSQRRDNAEQFLL